MAAKRTDSEQRVGDADSEMLTAEYGRMAALESSLWWYTSLHADVLDLIERDFGANRDLRILDAGCGTGGFLRALRARGYDDVQGVDLSALAVEHCRAEGLQVWQGSICDEEALARAGRPDVIVSLDVLCSLPDEAARLAFLRAAMRRLAPGGLLIVQTPAFPCLAGIHDLAVCVRHRYTRRDMRHLLARAGIAHARLRYRLVLLTPLIFLVRALQRRRLKRGIPVPIESDVKLPSRPLNGLLHGLQRLEDRCLPLRPFGTSLQIFARKEH